MRSILLVLSVVMLLFTGCYAKSAYFKKEDTAELRKCEKVGWGIEGTAAAAIGYNKCVGHYYELGYERITKDEYKKLEQK